MPSGEYQWVGKSNDITTERDEHKVLITLRVMSLDTAFRALRPGHQLSFLGVVRQVYLDRQAANSQHSTLQDYPIRLESC